MFLGKSILKIYNKFIGEHPCWSEISVKLHSEEHKQPEEKVRLMFA